jgi:hypothetical protein
MRPTPNMHLCPPSDRVAQLYPPDKAFPFRRLLRLAGYGGGTLPRLHTGVAEHTLRLNSITEYRKQTNVPK